MKGAPRSGQFDDIYFSAEDGLAETQHVFLTGNDLPNAWDGAPQFTICETGFGTGLNFLAVWTLFEETAKAGQSLDFISFEQFPLTPDQIKEALRPWQDVFGDKIARLCADYPLRIAGFHRLKLSPAVTLTLIIDDVNLAIPQLDCPVHAWFLDGFTPSKNPAMWTQTLFDHMARLSVNGANLASFTAAGFVRRGLTAAGFSVQKTNGFGHKRDMITGRFTGAGTNDAPPPLSCGARVAVIGGGLAGTAMAYTLKQYGFAPVLFEREAALASGASGNEIGLYNPRFTAQRDPVSAFFAPAYAAFIRLAQHNGEPIEYDPCGALHLINSPEKEKRFQGLTERWGWHADHVRLLTAQEASDLAGITLDQAALYLPQSGSVSPHKLCSVLAQGIETRLLDPVTSLKEMEQAFDHVILCNAFEAQTLLKPLSVDLPLEKIRGQITQISTPDALLALRCNLHYGGYASSNLGGRMMIGATFQKWIDHREVTTEDHEQNINILRAALPFIPWEGAVDVIHGRASFRTATPDRFPVVGSFKRYESFLSVSAAFGSHGLLGALQGAILMADRLRGVSAALPIEVIRALSPNRFSERVDRKTKKQA